MNRRGFQKSARGFYFVPLMSVFSKPRTRDDNACHVSLARRPIGWCRPAYHAQMHVSVPLRVHGGGEIQRDLSVTLTGTRHKALTSARTSLYALNWLALGRRTVVSAGAPAPWPKPPPTPPWSCTRHTRRSLLKSMKKWTFYALSRCLLELS